MAPRASQSLTILTTNKPIKSSNLALPPSPFSPQSPITPPPHRPSKVLYHHNIDHQLTSKTPFVPSEPLSWLWQCHLCRRCYRLGTTRRCLDDGHFFCSGATVVKKGRRSGKRIIKHKACQSEFDYQGWKVWGDWRRDVHERAQRESLLRGIGSVIFDIEGLDNEITKNSGAKDCWNRCDYPSECRWGKQFGMRTASPPPPLAVVVPSSPQVKTVGESRDDIELDFGFTDDVLMESKESATLTPPDQETKQPSMDDLLDSAKRRKRRSTGAAPSPLASTPPSRTIDGMIVDEQERKPTTQVSQKAFDDFETDFRKSFGGLVSVLGKGRRGSAPSVTMSEGKKGKEKSSSRRTGL